MGNIKFRGDGMLFILQKDKSCNICHNGHDNICKLKAEGGFVGSQADGLKKGNKILSILWVEEKEFKNKSRA